MAQRLPVYVEFAQDADLSRLTIEELDDLADRLDRLAWSAAFDYEANGEAVEDALARIDGIIADRSNGTDASTWVQRALSATLPPMAHGARAYGQRPRELA